MNQLPITTWRIHELKRIRQQMVDQVNQAIKDLDAIGFVPIEISLETQSLRTHGSKIPTMVLLTDMPITVIDKTDGITLVL